MQLVAFGVQIVMLGMRSLATQIYAIILLMGGSVLLVNRVGADDSVLGRRLAIPMHSINQLD